ncbi:uncharacterized protein LOC135171574 [Diachasmimorpha longicaudata]|uniref:uncharacterized protein LOC135171574 n=1 Tax=Diachasmimorpha longicaudata TaxID=58733 RepID=UPI0030B8E346
MDNQITEQRSSSDSQDDQQSDESIQSVVPTISISDLSHNAHCSKDIPKPMSENHRESEIQIKKRMSEVPPLGQLNGSQRFKLQQIELHLDTLNHTNQELHQALESSSLPPLTCEELNGLERTINADWKEMLDVHTSLSDELNPTQEDIIKETFQSATVLKRECLRMIFRLNGELQRKSAQSNSTSSSQLHQLKRISLPPFDGRHSEWKQFSDLFQSLVGKDQSIPPVQKLVRLKEALRGTAASLISTFTVTDDNYEKAWEKLVRKYEDPRLITQALFNRILNLPKISKATEESLSSNSAAALETMDQLVAMTGLSKEQLIEQMIVHLLRKSLDTETLRAWERYVGSSKDFPTLQEVTSFVDSCGRGINAGSKLHANTEKNHQSTSAMHHRKKSALVVASAQKEPGQTPKDFSKDNCAFCKEAHFISSCPKFIDLSPDKRNEVVASKRLCFNCLGPHLFSKCKSSKTCYTCKRRHHTLIHGGNSYTGSGGAERRLSTAGDQPIAGPSHNGIARENSSTSIINEKISEPTEKIIEEGIINQEISQQSSHHSSGDHQHVLLATAQAKAYSAKGYSLLARILIDQGSELSFVSDSLVHQLQLQRRSSSIEIAGIGGINSGRTRGVVSILLQAVHTTQQIQIHALILKKLTARLPSFSCSTTGINHFRGLQLADPGYLTPGPIDIIIGADIYGRIIENRVVKPKQTHLVGQQTIFGWIITGPIENQGCSPRVSLTAVRNSSNEQLLELLQKFWTQEELPYNSHQELSLKEIECEEFFKRTHFRDIKGRYIVRLPLRTSAKVLGESRFIASRQLQSVTRRLKSNEAYAKLYTEFIEEYESLGHMRKSAESTEPAIAYYLPHHGVLRTDAITTKLRVVFNGSSPSSSGLSLNDILYPGEKLQVDTMNVLTWLRRHRFTFGTDIVKMFRQIANHELIIYRLTTVTYGLNCSPWLSLRVLQQLAEDEGHRYPAAVEPLTKGRYVDDIYGGADTVHRLKEIAWQLQGLCEAGGFPLQKWSTNCPTALEDLGLSTNSSPIQFEESITKVLGLCWHQSSDTFRYKSKEFTSQTFTKRSVLSEIAQLFDPLGFLAPVVVRGKMIIQDLWRLKINWDESLPQEYVRKWRNFRENINELEKISVPRWLRISSNTSGIEIHGFADASTVAMSAVVYIRCKEINQPASVTMVCAKTKVAPLKRMTIPRLELTAAVLLTQLVVTTQKMLELTDEKIHLWSDSAVALAWIRSHSSRWKDFVQNRVNKIQESLPTATWRHISGKENPADCASRGITTRELSEHKLWWSGPEWLTQENDHWPSSPIDIPEEAAIEARATPAHPATAMQVKEIAAILNKYSTLEKVLQVSATISRAIKRFRREEVPQSPVLTTQELNEARIFWVKLTQTQYFASAYRILVRDQQLPKNHPMAKLTPIINEEGIIRLGGRLKNSLLDPDEIHPVILPRQSRLTTLIIEEAHRRTLHGGTQLTLAYTRQKYWIIGGRGTVRAYILRCAICTRHRARRAQQQMGQLPAVRVSPTRAFLHTGVDYAGPLPILKWRPTNAQPSRVHIAVFVCFSTSAVHLELVTRETVEGFIGAYKRFTGRRGFPKVMYSDNATTFTGTSKVLTRLYNQQTEENQQIQAALATNGTQWSFSPPRAPHFGGKWEAAVKSTKHHLKRVLGPSTYTYEELNSVLVQIEACLNSRPITPMSDDPEDLQALTPGHFLIGEPLQLVPEPSLVNENPIKLQRWNLVTQKVQQFWARWSRECLQRYQAIYKWNQRRENIKVGDMVLMVDEDYPPAQWPIARVIAVHPGADSLTRVATVRTSRAVVPTNQNGTPIIERVSSTSMTFKRPIAKLCLLPTDPPPAETPPEDEPEPEPELIDE